MATDGGAYVLRDAPSPHTDWYVDVSVTTMSASPMELGDTKLMGFGERLVYVNRLERSHVVAHWMEYVDRVMPKVPSAKTPATTNKRPIRGPEKRVRTMSYICWAKAGAAKAHADTMAGARTRIWSFGNALQTPNW